MFNPHINEIVQNFGSWLYYPMLFFTSFGYENIYLVFMAILYWCINEKLGFRVGVMLLMSSVVSSTLKVFLHTPRPYWVDTNVIAYSSESSFGFPSGHALMSTATYGRVGIDLKQKFLRAALFLFIFFIGVSRIFLGVHFLGDVLGGWVIGFLILTLGISLEQKVEFFASKQSKLSVLLIGFLASLTMLAIFSLFSNFSKTNLVLPPEWINAWENNITESHNPFDPAGIWTVSGAFFGMIVGRIFIVDNGGFSVKVSALKRTIRLIIGMAGVLLLYAGLGQIFPSGEHLLALVLRYLRYALVGFWISGAAHWLFHKLEKYY